MKNKPNKKNPNDFYINKWFLDFTGDEGEAMIFYAAQLKWHGFLAHYTSWLNYSNSTGVKVKSRFSHVHYPIVDHKTISWSDSKFGISGIWESDADSIQTRLFNSENGYLDWNCIQPSSKVQLNIQGKIVKGIGYAEQLIMTVPAWKIPMNELRWGRFASDQNYLVWIELRKTDRKKWLWVNGEKVTNCSIEDDQILIPEKKLSLNLDKNTVLESEKKIFSVVEKLVRYIPGFNKIIPLNFIMADETKWVSNGTLKMSDKVIDNGKVIHEFVNFNVKTS